MMLSISYLLYSVNYLVYMFTNNNKDNQVREYMHVSLGFTVYN